MPRRNMSSLVRTTTDDLAPIRRGRGLDSMLSDGESTAPTAMPETPTLESKSTSQQVNKSASGFENNQTTVPPARVEPTRSIKSIRLRDDLIVAIDTLAASERRKIYEVVEEALIQYLGARGKIG